VTKELAKDLCLLCISEAGKQIIMQTKAVDYKEATKLNVT